MSLVAVAISDEIFGLDSNIVGNLNAVNLNDGWA